MLRLAKAFWDLALWRISPAQLPASQFLLGLVIGAVALLEVIGALLPPSQSDRIVARVGLSVLLPLAWTWIVLNLTRHRPRFLQTAIALLGIAALAQLVLYPLDSLLNWVGADHPLAIPLAVLSFAGLVWYVLACGNVWRSALDSSLWLGIAVSIGYLVLSIALEQFLLPES